MQDSHESFSKRRRKLQTPWRVKAADSASRAIITIGGVGTIIAMSLLAVMLFWEVFPLFKPAVATRIEGHALPLDQRQPIHMRADEYRTLSWVVCDDGTLQVYRLGDGAVIEDRVLSGGEMPTAMSFPLAGESRNRGAKTEHRTVIASGYANGEVQFFNVDIITTYLDDETVPEALHDLEEGVAAPYEDGVVQRTPTGQFRHQAVVVSERGERRALLDGPVVAMDHVIDGSKVTMIAAGGRGDTQPQLKMATGRLSGGAFTVVNNLPYTLRGGQHASHVKLSGIRDQVFAIWPDGLTTRLATSDPPNAYVAEELDVAPLGGEVVTSVQWLLGQATLLVGTSEGRLNGYFTIRPADYDVQDQYPDNRDGVVFLRAKPLAPPSGSPITSLDSSTRTRLIVSGDQAGIVRSYYVTSELELIALDTEQRSSVGAVAISPKEDAIYATDNSQLFQWSFDKMHPEATMETLFRPVWYENYAVKLYMWQSTGGSDDYEPKYSLVPLVFGTIKATFYGMLFGAPLALMAAIFTSEFLPPRWKARIKPTIELMASLPSVVLGFLAALVFAPVLEGILPAVLSMMLVVPLTFMLGAYLWQLLPFRFTVIARPYRFMVHLALLPVGVVAALLAGPTIERLLFAGNIKLWLNGSLSSTKPYGSPVGGWLFLLMPVAVLVVGLVMTTIVNPRMRTVTPHLTRRKAAMLDLGKFVVGAVVALSLALGVGFVLSQMGVDSRAPWTAGGFDLAILGQFDQRNALLIGWVLGFAVIPIIYTISEDALSSVPEHLRSGSLGSGATPWQTAVRIVVPTAMSGLFSAMMIGLGRAVGETMIVLMAFGNTPLLDLNMLSGSRTLASNIAVELPEAVPGTTHYRVLFLCGFVLFVMTFFLNTVAELVRMRFRKRAVSL